MKKGQVAEGIVRYIDFPNKGMVYTAEDDKVIVKNTIPGQKVSFLVNKVRKGKAEARLLEVIERSELETASDCPHFEKCGGCTYRTLPYEKQLELKEEQVRRLMEEAIGDACEYEFLGIRPSPCKNEYRNKMEFSFGDEFKDGPLALGMHRRGSFYDLVTVDQCQIVDSDFRAILMATLHYFTEKNVTFFHRLRHVGYLRHLLVRKAARTGEILVDLVTTTQPAQAAGDTEDGNDTKSRSALQQNEFIDKISAEEESRLLEGWRDSLLALKLQGTFKGILHTRNDSVADVVKNEGTDILHGEDFFYEELLGLRFRISPFSFFQTNSLGAEVLYDTAREFVLNSYYNGDTAEMRGATIYDLYSGTGTIAQMMASVCGHVVGVEIVEEAVAAAKDNAKLNGLDNCDFLAGDVLKVLDTIEDEPDYIILDPPRDGIHPKALEKIIDYGVENIVYISCKPTSLARDLEVFLARGYRVEKIACVDMFPGTYHVETVVLLSRITPDAYITVALDMSELDLTSAEAKATYNKIRDFVKNKYGFHVTNLNIAQVKQHYGIIERENYNVGEGKSRVPNTPKEKFEAIEEALKFYKMI